MKKLLILLLFVPFIWSCESETETLDIESYGYDYYPLTVGNEWVYEVDSVVLFSGGNIIRETTSYVRDAVIDLISEEGDTREYRLERSFSDNADGPWKITDIWTTSIDGTAAYRTEENLKFIKLTFPLMKGKSWDGNVFFDENRDVQVGPDNFQLYKDWRYRIISDELIRTYGNDEVNDIIEVEHVDADDDSIEKKLSIEYYAKGIGLVERQMEVFGSEMGKPAGQSWVEGADSGFSFSQRLVSYQVQ